MKIALFPGSFDPITNGHLDILKQALPLFDEIIVLVANNPDKKADFSVEERLALIKEATKEYPNVKVDYTDGLTVTYAKEHGAKTIIRGIRNQKDLEYEERLTGAYKALDSTIEVLLLIGHDDVSSTLVKSLIKKKKDVSPFVPEAVSEFLKK